MQHALRRHSPIIQGLMQASAFLMLKEWWAHRKAVSAGRWTSLCRHCALFATQHSPTVSGQSMKGETKLRLLALVPQSPFSQLSYSPSSVEETNNQQSAGLVKYRIPRRDPLDSVEGLQTEIPSTTSS